jgi:hypothetical protein
MYSNSQTCLAVGTSTYPLPNIIGTDKLGLFRLFSIVNLFFRMQSDDRSIYG